MVGKVESLARRVTACVLTVLLVVGLLPTLPEMPRALAEESKAVQLGGGKDGGATTDATIKTESDDAVVLDEDVESAILGQLEQIAENAEAQGAGTYGPMQTEKVVPEAGIQSNKADEGEAILEAQSVSVSNPRVVADSSMESGQVATWDCVWFGSYPQTEVAPGDAAYASLQSASWDTNGDATVGGAKYRRISKSKTTYSGYWSEDGYGSATYRYFRFEPIKWRVLKVSGSSALVVADRGLDDHCYNSYAENVTWETSSVRSWLNGYGAAYNQPRADYSSRSFLSAAFSVGERSVILTTNVTNADNTSYGTVGAATGDRVFLLSEAEVYDTAHGFVSSYDTHDEARRCKPTDYAHAMGACVNFGSKYDGNCWWWLRSPGNHSSRATSVVTYYGYVGRGGYFVSNDPYAVRPALNLNLASSYYQYAGTVSSNGEVNEVESEDDGQEIIDLVRSYGSDDSASYVTQIINDSRLSREEKTARLRAYFSNMGITDPLEGIHFLSKATDKRLAYRYLITGECFMAHDWSDWLCNTLEGRLKRGLLYASGLIFNYEVSSYLNPFDHINKDLPGMKKYKAVLKKFMETSKSNSALAASKDTLSFMNKLLKYNEGINDTELDEIMDRIDELSQKNPSSSELESLQLKFSNILASECITTGGVAVDLREITENLGYGLSCITFANATAQDIVAMINLNSDIQTYKRYRRFLEHVANDVDLPDDMRTAAASVMDEIENGYFNRIVSIFGNAIKFDQSVGVLTTSKKLLLEALKKFGFEDFSDTLGAAFSTLTIGTVISNIVVDMGDFVNQAAYTLAYAELGASYANKLKQDEIAFSSSQSEEDAWQFFEDYTILWKLRYMGEEQYRDMHKMKMFIFASVPTFSYKINAEAVEENLQFLEKCRFDLPDGIVVPEGVMYEQKAVFRCPVDVDVYAPDGTLVASMADGAESDVTNEHGRFVVTYDAWSGEWAKVACLNDGGDYKMVTRGNDLGTMSVQIARRGEDTIQSIDNVAVVPGSSVRLGTGFAEDSNSFEVDGDGDGEYESAGEVREDDLGTERVQVETVEVDKQEIELPECGSELLGVSVQPSDATNQQVAWMSRDESVAKVVGGKVEGVGPGETTVLCISQDNTDIIAECAVRVYATEPAFRTQSLTLGGTIGVNFFADLSPLTDAEREGCKATFSVNGCTTEDTFDSTFVNAKGYYGFTCPVTSVEMADEIEAILTWGEGKSISKRHSVADYMASFEKYAPTFDEETRALVRSVADYGHYVQPFLAGARGWAVGVDHAEMAPANAWDGTEADAAEAASEGYALACDMPDGCGVQRMTQALVLDSGTDLCLFAACDEGASVASARLADGRALPVVRDPDGRWRITVPGIAAHDLGRRWNVFIETSAGKAVTVETSALAWVRSALTYEEWRGDAVARNAAASIWRYAKAAESYKLAHPGV